MRKSVKIISLLLSVMFVLVFASCESKTPEIVNDGRHETINYGTYAQSLVTDATLISALEGVYWSNGKAEYNGTEYVKLTATPYRSGGTFTDGTKIVEGETYYFSVDPISWYSLGDNVYFAQKILDIHVFNSNTEMGEDGEHPNNWAVSDLRAWLNDDFMNTAFSTFDIATIELTRNESAYPESYYEAHSVNIEPTMDKVYALSYAETVDANLSFTTDGETNDFLRMAKVSDYARAKGAYFYVSSASEDDADYAVESVLNGNGDYWLRTIGWERANAGCVRYNGTVGKYYKYVNRYYEKNSETGKTLGGVGVRPAITLSIDF